MTADSLGQAAQWRVRETENPEVSGYVPLRGWHAFLRILARF